MSLDSANVPFSMEDFALALDQENADFQRGQVVQGKVVSYSTDGVFLDIGGKAPALLPKKEAGLLPILDLEAAFPLGESVNAMVIRDQDAEGQVTVSVRSLQAQRAWERIRELEEAKQVVQARVTGSNRGGVTVEVEGLRGFVPRSHLSIKDEMDSLKGKTLTLTFLEVNPADRKLVLSERLAAQTARFSQLEVGQLVTGQVSGLKPFGVFVSFEGSTGLLHINQISNKFVSQLDTVFSVGQELKALIVALDEGRGRISLSTRVLENYAGEMLENPADVLATAEDRAERARKQLEAV
jgi:small subunit ribosomal protein S1